MTSQLLYMTGSRAALRARLLRRKYPAMVMMRRMPVTVIMAMAVWMATNDSLSEACIL